MAEKDKKPEIRFKGFKEDWEQCKVGNFYEFKNGLNKGKDFFGHGVPIVNFTDVFHNRGINTSKLKGKVKLQPSEVANFMVQKGDIFFTRTSETIDEIGYPAVMLDEPIDTVFSGFVLRCRAIKDDPLTLKFKCYVFYTDEFRKEMIKKSSMTTRALTSGTVIKQMELHFPKNKVEQDKIGNFFQYLDNLITLHQHKYEKLVNVKKSMLEKMFPKKGADAPEIRFKGFTGAWEQCKLGELAQITMGQSPNSENYTDNPNAHILVQGNADMKNGVVLPRVWTTQVTKQAEKNDLILSVRAPVGDVGKTDYDIVLGRGVAGIKGNEFIFQLLNRMKENGYWRNLSTGSTFESINSNDIKDAHVLIPHNNEQNKIGEFFKHLDTLIALHQRQLEKLKNIKKACLEKMFV